MFEPSVPCSRTMRGPYGTRSVTGVAWPTSGVQLSMKRSNDCSTASAIAKTTERTIPATAPALIRVRSMGSRDLPAYGPPLKYHRTYRGRAGTSSEVPWRGRDGRGGDGTLGDLLNGLLL